MKKYIAFAFGICLFTSCSDYLDVTPKSQVDRDLLFQTEEGFMEALNGLYLRGSSGDIYGNELTFGFLDVLAQNYSSVDNGTNFPYQQTLLYNYKDENFVRRTNAVWLGLYSGIANCNSLLDNIDAREGLFTGKNYELIKGEAMALRAFYHFDALRIFAPSYVTGAGESGIPYVSRFTNKVSPTLTVSQAVDSVIRDLNIAKDLLRGADPIVQDSYVVGYAFDGDDGDVSPDDESNEETGTLFVQNRRHRMNYYAVCGALARAYLFKGDKGAALNNAREVMESEKFPFVDLEIFAHQDDEQRDHIIYPELLFGWYIPTMDDDLQSRFDNSSQSMYTSVDALNTIYEKASVGGEDYRLRKWFKPESNGATTRMMLTKYEREDDNIHPLMAPAIRLSEMYYIAAECVYDSDPFAAWDYFNTIRKRRGIGVTYEIPGGSYDELIDNLLKEARKEFFGEGQLFYMYKRLNHSIKGINGSDVPASNDVFVLPMPDAEIELGQRG
jgi:starch-binding outer membrane protein, SusD/RagB family